MFGELVTFRIISTVKMFKTSLCLKCKKIFTLGEYFLLLKTSISLIYIILLLKLRIMSAEIPAHKSVLLSSFVIILVLFCFFFFI